MTTTSPGADCSPRTITRGHAGRTTGNGAVPDPQIYAREAACRKGPATV
ncbi:hypothetical protein GCM10010149_43230 [Nonomuraea roseoviolacea subsp. roseoviolacea]|uniref:Uncharacterized protein n=1 Tax=Nonomuraea roseoviolacea subsp. carminata TaxID=160689 RepID=A0ABT1JZ45_9ACTN|nr:hypothetical protein [Nonomuraea roseoviolacea]MCP2346870.1 hypothetical protein [Nonomuraea roseoviolacea subsp. carminata]